ncbi:MAG TPA: C40 family peptidase [Acidimicrobiales bacterium]|nr:C40 family peptidase [Acidimicrobiales bacterium]
MTRPIRAVGLLVACLVATATAPLPASADTVAEKRAEAERIAAELEEQGRRISVLAEQVNNARLEAERVEAAAAAAAADLAQAEREVEASQARLKVQAVNAYVRGGRLPTVQEIVGGNPEEMGVRNTYVRTVLRQERDALEALRSAREERSARKAALEDTRRAARDALAAVESSRREAATAEAQQRATLGRVQGELAALVEADRRRREEEAARRAREELARRQAAEEAERRRRAAEEEARRARTPSTTPSTAPGGEASAPARPPAAGADAAVAEAKRQLGKPYQWGAAGPDSFDCSGLTQWAWKAGGRSLPHSSQAQYSATSRVALNDLQPGDLVFYGSPIHHVGIYVGNGQMVEASETGTPVRYASIFRRDYVGAGRVG